MLRRAVDYLTRAIRRSECSDVYAQVKKIIQGFGEFPGGMNITELFQHHTVFGWKMLNLHESASRCAWAALERISQEVYQTLWEGFCG